MKFIQITLSVMMLVLMGILIPLTYVVGSTRKP